MTPYIMRPAGPKTKPLLFESDWKPLLAWDAFMKAAELSLKAEVHPS